jgi:hypothetical protein
MQMNNLDEQTRIFPGKRTKFQKAGKPKQFNITENL